MEEEAAKKVATAVIILILISLSIFAVINWQNKEETGYPNPLLTSGYVPSKPSYEDYLYFTDFGDNKTVQDFLYFLTFTSGNVTYTLKIYYDKHTQAEHNSSITIYIVSNSEIYRKTYYDNMKIYKDSDKISLVSTSGMLYSDIYPDSLLFTIHLESDVMRAYLNFTGKPFWYNDGKTAEIAPGEYVWGFEILGDVKGTVNGNEVRGYGYFERINFNILLENTPYFINWLVFCSENIKLLIYRQGEYRDGGIWINNKYYKPSDFMYSELETDGNGVVSFDMKISVNISGNMVYMDLKGERINSDLFSTVLKSSLKFSNEDYSGMTFIDTRIYKY